MEPDRTNSPLGIYLHIPFCERKCFYCDFYSIENHSQRDEFVSSLLREIEIFSENHPRFAADTIFFGGGTPSLLKPAEVEMIVDSLSETFDISENVELTMECNPGTVDVENLRGYGKIGVNRVSFGVQSFFDDELKFLQRIHTSREAVKAIEEAHRLGFGNINLDLMYALPDQKIERLVSNLETAVALNPDHLSVYALIVEPGTPLYAAVNKSEIEPADDETEAAMYETTMAFLRDRGYNHYEVSNYSRPGRECRHNLKYWDRGEYVGFGPSAHSHLNGVRSWNVSSLREYIDSIDKGRMPVTATEHLTSSQLADEFVFLQLRQGRLDLARLHNQYNFDPDADFILKSIQAGYFCRSEDTIFLSEKGFVVCDEIAKEMLSAYSPEI